MIRGRCRTNLDDFQGVTWPEVFVDVPRVGEYVEGSRGNTRPTLRVVSVTHTVARPGTLALVDVGQPYIIVELHQ